MARPVLHSISTIFMFQSDTDGTPATINLARKRNYIFDYLAHPYSYLFKGNSSFVGCFHYFSSRWNIGPRLRRECHFIVTTAFVPSWSHCPPVQTQICHGWSLTSARISVVENQHSPATAPVSPITEKGHSTSHMVHPGKPNDITVPITVAKTTFCLLSKSRIAKSLLIAALKRSTLPGHRMNPQFLEASFTCLV